MIDSIVSNSYRRYNTNNEEIADSELSFSDINFKSEEAYKYVYIGEGLKE